MTGMRNITVERGAKGWIVLDRTDPASAPTMCGGYFGTKAAANKRARDERRRKASA